MLRSASPVQHLVQVLWRLDCPQRLCLALPWLLAIDRGFLEGLTWWNPAVGSSLLLVCQQAVQMVADLLVPLCELFCR